jgi:aldehyde dehydrogenase (NAD(P)+)
VTSTLADDLTRLAAASPTHAGRDAPARAALALRTARSVAGAAGQWTGVAVEIKHRHERAEPAGEIAGKPAHGGACGQAAVAWAEEAATGPLATLRLLLLTARACADVARQGRPRLATPPRVLHPAGGAGPASFVAVDVLPARQLLDRVVFRDHAATVRCVNPGGVPRFLEAWNQEVRERPGRGGVALVLGAGNVTGLAVADACCQIFEHGRVVLLKLHPLHAPLEPVLRAALAPLIAADVLAIRSGGPEIAREAVADPRVAHVHLTGGRAAFDALVWGGPGPRPAGAVPVLDKPLTCELGNVTPWFVVPGRYTSAQLRHQADLVAGSIAHNTSFNCIATKCVVTGRAWAQRDEFLAQVARRLESQPPRPAWYPGSTAAWESLAERPAPADGTLPWLVRTGLDPAAETPWLAREWFLPAVVEVSLPADTIEDYCTAAGALAHRLPGTLAASVTIPRSLPPHEARRASLFVEHLEYGVVAVNTWVALGYALGSVPWGGYPGGTLAEPHSGIGWVHDPLLLPLVHNTIVRGPLVAGIVPPWLPWHTGGAGITRGVIGIYGAIAGGGSGLGHLLAMVPAVLRG